MTSQKTIPAQDSLIDALKTELPVLRARIGVPKKNWQKDLVFQGKRIVELRLASEK